MKQAMVFLVLVVILYWWSR